MVILPKNKFRKIKYYFTFHFKSKLEIGLLLSHFGALASIAGLFWKGFTDPANLLPLILISFFALTALLYSKRYFEEKERSNKYKKSLYYIHKIQERIRKINETSNKNNFISEVQESSKQICMLLKDMLESFYYSIDDVCIKVFDVHENKIKVVARANKTRIDQHDIEEPLDKNPFASILLRVHSFHNQKLGEIKEIRDLPQNQYKNQPIFFALGDIHSNKVPIFLDKIFPDTEINPEYNHEKYMNDLKTRTQNKYNSCFGVMITKPVSINHTQTDQDVRRLQLSNHVGFIGFDSKDNNLFDYFDFELTHIFAGVADSLYTNMSFYKDESIRKILWPLKINISSDMFSLPLANLDR